MLSLNGDDALLHTRAIACPEAARRLLQGIAEPQYCAASKTNEHKVPLYATRARYVHAERASPIATASYPRNLA